MSNRSIAAVHKTAGLVATKPGVNIINGGGGSKPWEAKCCRTSLGTFSSEEEAFEAYSDECKRRGMIPRLERAMRAGNPALTEDSASPSAIRVPASKQRVTTARGTWNNQEVQQMRDAVAKQLHRENFTAPGLSLDWDGIAEALQTGRTGAAVYQKWNALHRDQTKPDEVDTTRPPRSQRERKHKVLPDDEINIDYVDQDYFDEVLDTHPRKANDTQTADTAVAKKKKRRVGEEILQERLPRHKGNAKAAASRGLRAPIRAPASRPGAAQSRSMAATTTSFSGIEYVQSDASWKLIACAVPAAVAKEPKKAIGGLQSAQLMRFDSEAAAARAYDTIVGQRVNYSLGDVVATVSFEMVGQGVHVTWNAEEEYCGEILAVDLRTNKARIKYDDGQTAWESITREDCMEQENEDAVNMRLLVPNTAVSLVGNVLDDAEAASIDVDVIRQYLSFWYAAARFPKPTAATSQE